MPTIYGAVDLVKNELRQAAIQNLGTAPATPVKGQVYFNTTDNVLYWYNGTTWVAAQGGTGGPSGPAGGDLSGTFPNPSVVQSSPGTFTIQGTPGKLQINAASFGTLIGLTTLSPSYSAQISLNGALGFNCNLGFNFTGGDLDVASHRIKNVTDPVSASDAATRNYVDGLINGLSWKNACRVASTANVTTIGGLLTIDGITLVAGDRVLLKNQTAPEQNGIYVAAVSNWARAQDADLWQEFVNAAVYISVGTANKDTQWVCNVDAGGTLNTTAIPWTQVGAGVSYTAGAGLTLTGVTFDIGAGTGIIVNADTIQVDSTVVALKTDLTAKVGKYAAALTGGASPEVVTHNLNTRDVSVTVYNGATPFTAVEVDWDATSVNTVTIRYNPNLGAGYRVVVMG